LNLAALDNGQVARTDCARKGSQIISNLQDGAFLLRAKERLCASSAHTGAGVR
jgi:hypothetical protein